MIDRVHFESFQCLRNVTLDLRRFTALVGANGCGKSSVLLGMHLLSRAAEVGVGAVFCGPRTPERLLHRGRPGTIVLAMRDTRGEDLRLEIHVGKEAELDFEIEGAHRTGNPTLVQLDVADDEVAATLAWMERTSPDKLAQITADLRRAIQGVKRIETHRELRGDAFAIEFDNGSEVPADLLGEGTARALRLLTALRAPDRPNLVLIDDLERGLHLSAQSQIVTMIHEAVFRDPELQVICATHSPYLLDLLDPSEVSVLALDAERCTRARPLTDHPEFDKWRFGARTGELWAALGEEWVLEAEQATGSLIAGRTSP